MIKVTKLNGEVFYVNAFEIEFLEETPDTVISLKSGKKVLVREKAEPIIRAMVAFYGQINRLPLVKSPAEPAAEEEND